MDSAGDQTVEGWKYTATFSDKVKLFRYESLFAPRVDGSKRPRVHGYKTLEEYAHSSHDFRILM